MSTSNTQAALGFADVQQAITQIVNDNTAQNNAVAAQIQEVQQLILDFNNRASAGNPPSQADYQQAIAQLQAVHSLVQQNTASVQASGSAITTADPNAVPTPAGTSTPTPTPNPSPTPVTTPGPGTTTGAGVSTTTSSSGVGSGAAPISS